MEAKWRRTKRRMLVTYSPRPFFIITDNPARVYKKGKHEVRRLRLNDNRTKEMNNKRNDMTSGLLRVDDGYVWVLYPSQTSYDAVHVAGIKGT